MMQPSSILAITLRQVYSPWQVTVQLIIHTSTVVHLLWCKYQRKIYHHHHRHNKITLFPR